MAYEGDRVVNEIEIKGKPYEEVLVACKRCGGSGHFSYNEIDGTKCYGCGGSGYNKTMRRILTEKEKLQKEKAKQKRMLKQEQKRKEESELRKKQQNENLRKKLGFDNNPSIYLVLNEDSYDYKEALKEQGAIWNKEFNKWSFSSKMDKYKLLEIKENDFLYLNKNNFLSINEEYVISIRKSFSKSNYVGEINEKINSNVTVKNITIHYSQIGRIRVRTRIINLLDSSGNKMTWFTTSDKMELNCSYLINAKVKGHDSYNYEKITILKNVKIINQE